MIQYATSDLKNYNMRYYFLLFSMLFSLAGAQDLFTLDKSKEFANYLFANGEYELAEPEYQRLYFASSDDTFIATRYMLCNYSLADYQKNIKLYNTYIKQGDVVPQALTEVYLRSLIMSNSPQLELELPILTSANQQYYQLSYLMLNSRWEEARQLYASEKNELNCNRYASILILQDNIDYKKVGPAVLLSTIIPGAGKAYAGYWQDALFSCVFVGLSAWQSYRGFDKKGVQSVYGWLYGTVGFGFYLGNIFGSAKAVHKRNYEIDHDLHHQIHDTFTSTPF